jgi:RNA polymerase sigma-70 factor (ECF subfamily)
VVPAEGERRVRSTTPDDRREDPVEAAVREDLATHAPELYHVVRRSLGDDGLAEEVVQDVVVRAWRARDRFDERRGSRRTWLFAIARNAVVDAVRHRRRRPQPAATIEEGSVVVEDDTDQVVLRLQVHAALRTLSDEQRTAIVEVHHRGRPYAEVAEELGVPVGTLRSRVYYGLRAMRAAMIEQGWTDEA